MGYSHHFPRHVQQDGDHRRVVVAVDDEAHLLQPGPEVSGVVCQLADPSNTSRKARTPHAHIRRLEEELEELSGLLHPGRASRAQQMVRWTCYSNQALLMCKHGIYTSNV